ncbi:MAG: class I SAM-dependent methyltransferase [Dehalococcoidia bacterium]
MTVAGVKPGSLLARFLLGDRPPEDDAAFKACCAYLYDHPAVRWLLGDSHHPGGEELSLHLGGLLGVPPGGLVLDVATGQGGTPRVLAEGLGCRVVGLDFGAPVLPGGRRPASGPLAFCRGDAEALPFADSSLDAIVCECSFCLLPDKPRAAAEFRRVLRPGGRLGLSDMTLAADAREDGFADVLWWAACLADARPLAEYESLMGGAGLHIVRTEDHTAALAQTLSGVRKKLLVLQIAAKVGEIKLRKSGDQQGLEAFSLARELVSEGLSLTKRAQSMLQRGALGYCLLIAERV